jgi:hypothetical protein
MAGETRNQQEQAACPICLAYSSTLTTGVVHSSELRDVETGNTEPVARCTVCRLALLQSATLRDCYTALTRFRDDFCSCLHRHLAFALFKWKNPIISRSQQFASVYYLINELFRRKLLQLLDEITRSQHGKGELQYQQVACFSYAQHWPSYDMLKAYIYQI